MFDNEQDPYQLNNLLNVPGNEKLAGDLKQILKRKLKATNDEFLPGQVYVKKWAYPLDKTGTVPYSN
tara:strand:- start:1254 stop:1454 length:201 start_codon:yes stop_codon:yes gene_type:complete